MDCFVILFPVLLACVINFFLLRQSYKRATEVGFPKEKETERKKMYYIVVGASGIFLIFAVFEMFHLLSLIGIFDGTYEENRLTNVMDMASNFSAVAGFLTTISVGLAAVKRIHRENNLLAARLSKPNAEEIIDQRDPAAFRWMVIKMAVAVVLGAAALKAAFWLMDVDMSAWDEAAVHFMAYL